MKKVFSIVLAAAMAMSMAVTSMAAINPEVEPCATTCVECGGSTYRHIEEERRDGRCPECGERHVYEITRSGYKCSDCDFFDVTSTVYSCDR